MKYSRGEYCIACARIIGESIIPNGHWIVLTLSSKKIEYRQTKLNAIFVDLQEEVLFVVIRLPQKCRVFSSTVNIGLLGGDFLLAYVQ